MKTNASGSLLLPTETVPKGERRCSFNGQLHRVDGPAIEYADGEKHWYVDGNLHRVDGPAIERADGEKCWYVEGKLHRADGPAIEYADGKKEWWLNGEMHRVDGPAVEWADGTKEWHIFGEKMPENEHPDSIKKELLSVLEKSQATTRNDADEITGRAAKPKTRSI